MKKKGETKKTKRKKEYSVNRFGNERQYSESIKRRGW